MVKARVLTEKIETIAPLCYASQWDNVGLMIGSLENSVNNVLVCLDVTPDVVTQAVEKRCELIISHHPLLFKGVSVIDFNTPKGNMIKDIIKNDITVYSCHTNMDSANGGINSVLAEKFRLKGIEVLENNINFTEVGIGRIGFLNEEMDISKLCIKTKQILGTDFLKIVCNSPKKIIKKLCVASGSCGDLIQLASSKGADAIITSDVKYHEALEAKETGISVIDAGHYPTEILVCEIFKNILSDIDVEVFTANSRDVFSIA